MVLPVRPFETFSPGTAVFSGFMRAMLTLIRRSEAQASPGTRRRLRVNIEKHLHWVAYSPNEAGPTFFVGVGPTLTPYRSTAEAADAIKELTIAELAATKLARAQGLVAGSALSTSGSAMSLVTEMAALSVLVRRPRDVSACGSRLNKRRMVHPEEAGRSTPRAGVAPRSEDNDVAAIAGLLQRLAM